MRFCFRCYWLVFGLEFLVVIASEAKQSILPSAGEMDCFVAIAPRNDGPWPSFLHQRAARSLQGLERLIAGNGREQLVVVPAAFGFRGLLDLEQIHVVHHAAVLADPPVAGEKAV